MATAYAILLIAASFLSAVFADAVDDSRTCRKEIGSFYLNGPPKNIPDILPNMARYNWIHTAPALSALPVGVVNSMFTTVGMLKLSTQQTSQTPSLTYTDWLQVRLDSSWIEKRTQPPLNRRGANFAGTGTDPSVNKFVRTLGGEQSDDAGHIIARILGGTGEQNWNMFPIDKDLNRRKMAGAEDSVHRIIANKLLNPKSPNTVTLTVKMQYGPASPTRPVKVHYLAEYMTKVNNINVNNVCYWELVNPLSA